VIENIEHDPGNSKRYDVDPTTEILKTSQVIAVVGLSSRPFRPSFGVARYLQSAGTGSFR
jgi:predicted CoA-binding protein